MIPIGFFFGGGKRTDQTAGHKEGIGGSMTIAWDDQFKRQNIMWKVPRNVRMNDNVVVREDEIAVFYRDGNVLAYLDRPDRYALTSQNARILGRLIQALSGVVQQAEVYYLQKRIFDGKFGTQDAFLFQDPDFDMVQLRAFGDFRYRLKDPETFINQFVGTFGAATSAEVEDRIKNELMKQLNVTLGKMKANGLKVVDFAASLNDIEQGMLAQQQQTQQRPCPKCGTMNAVTTKFCGNCGADTTVAAGSKPCIKCGKMVGPGQKFCPECGAAQTLKCPDGHEVPGGMKFCPECGKPVVQS